MSTRSLTYQQSVFTRCDSDKHFSEFLPTRWRQKSTGIDTEQNYVTVSLCILLTTKCLNQQHYCCMCICPFVPPPTVQCGVSHALFIPNIFWGGFSPPQKKPAIPPQAAVWQIVCSESFFRPEQQLPSQPLSGLLPVLLLGEQRHDGCEQFA